MKRQSNSSFYTILKILWAITGTATAVLLIVCFVRLQKLESKGVGKNSYSTEQQKPSEDSVEGGDELKEPFEGSKDSGLTDKEAGAEGAESEGEGPEGEEPEAGDLEEEAESSANASAEERHIDPDKPMVAFSFDDGPSELATKRICDALTKNGASATFFMVGYNITRLPEHVKYVYESGCEVASHTQNHKNLTELSSEDLKTEIKGNEELLFELIPEGRLLLRPPYGSYNDSVKEKANAPLICWSVDSLDWKTRDCDSVVEQVMADVKDGYIVLMHDLYESTAEAVEVLLPKLKDAGYQIVSVSELFEARGEELLDGHVYRMSEPN